MGERLKVRRATIDDRLEKAAEIVNALESNAVVWCHLNDESSRLAALIPGSVEVTGSDSPEAKEEKLRAFSDGEIRVLVTKPVIGAWGLNWQHCHNVIVAGLSYSMEQLYQAIRRTDRFGQTHAVNVYVLRSEAEGDVLLFRMRAGSVAKHLGIMGRIGPEASFIHAYAGRAVTESALTLPWRRRIVARFEFPQEGAK